MDSVFKHNFIINTEIFFKGHFLYQLSIKTMGLTMQGKKQQGKTLDSERHFTGNLK